MPSRTVLALFAFALVAGCVPSLGPRPEPRGSGSVVASASLPGTAGVQWPSDGWWQDFGDPQLSRLIEEGLANAPDVATAAARVRRANALAEQAGAARQPVVAVQGGASLDKQSYNNGFPREFVPKGFEDRGQIAGTLAYDLDLWGRNRSALAAATSDARAAELDAAEARLALSAAIALAYVDLARAFDQRAVRDQALGNRAGNRRLVGIRVGNGLDNRGSLRAAEAEAEAAQGELSAADQDIAVRRHQLAALVGAGPDRGLTIARPVLRQAAEQALPEDVTTVLIARRPDIAAARARIDSAQSRIAVARAEFFPAIRLNALFGLQSLGLSNLVNSGSTYGSVGPALTLPIFPSSARTGQYRGAAASYDEAVASYDRAVVAAYQQAADAVTNTRALADRIALARRAASAADEAADLQRRRYRAGLSTNLDVLAVEGRALNARLQLTEFEAAARSAQIALVRALGGGFALSTTKDVPHG